MSLLSVFALWNIQAQPNNIPETRSYAGDAPDKYRVWPTEEFQTKRKPLNVNAKAIKMGLELKGLLVGGSKTDSLLILHKGKIVHEAYFNGYDKNKPHVQFSVTKSVVSALVGIAMGEGYINSVQDKVAAYFPKAVIPEGQENKKEMTIEHLLTMTSGIDTDPHWDTFTGEALQDGAQWIFTLPQKRAPGTKFRYDNMAPSILGGIIEKATGQRLLDYAQQKLFGPLGMTSVTWETAGDGLPFGAFGIFMTPRDMARFGYLYLNLGRWEGKQIIPADFVVKTPPRSMSVMGYGYLFWNYTLSPFSGSYEAQGMNGQNIIIMPKKDLVIVRTAQTRPIDGALAKLGSLFGMG